MKRPAIREIYSVLSDFNALIVHFSSVQQMVGDPEKKHLFPDDLYYVRDGGANGGLSCSTVMPGDQFDPMPRNSTGSVGLILGLKSRRSVKAAHPQDCGAYTDENGDRQVGQQPSLTIETNPK